MGPVLLGLGLGVALLASPFISRRLRKDRVAQPGGGPPARPAHPPAGRVAAPVVTVQPSSVMTGPFAYDNGLVIGPRQDAGGDAA